MKNTRLVVSILLTALLCASLAYWALKLIRPVERPLAAPQQAKPEINVAAASGLFGGKATGGQAAAVSTNFQLRGIIGAKSAADSVAIIAASGRPAQAVAVGGEVAPGVIVREIHPRYVLLSEDGASRRIDLPENLPPSTAPSSPVATSPAPPAPPPAAASSSPPPLPAAKMYPPNTQTPAQAVPAQPVQPGMGAQSAQPVQSSVSSRSRRQSASKQLAAQQTSV